MILQVFFQPLACWFYKSLKGEVYLEGGVVSLSQASWPCIPSAGPALRLGPGTVPPKALHTSTWHRLGWAQGLSISMWWAVHTIQCTSVQTNGTRPQAVHVGFGNRQRIERHFTIKSRKGPHLSSDTLKTGPPKELTKWHWAQRQPSPNHLLQNLNLIVQTLQYMPMFLPGKTQI